MRAERVKDREGIALHQLAKLYMQRGEHDKAAKCFDENLTRLDKAGMQTYQSVEAIRYLAKYL
jgi:anaphase-promoting complex subunit 8